MLGTDPSKQSEATMKQLETILGVRGGMYDQSHRTESGTLAIFKSASRGSLTWNQSTMEGVPVTDCSSLVTFGLRLGGDRGGLWTGNVYTFVGNTALSAKMNGRSIPNYLLKVNFDGSMGCSQGGSFAGSDYKPLADWVSKGLLQPGDIILMRTHISTVLAVNRTGANVVIPASLVGRSKDVTVRPNQVVTMTSSNYDQVSGIGNYSIWGGPWLILRPAFSSHAKSCP
jgi:hypothetical protein